ncbi:acyl-[acyl-carrier-protein] thioesterase [Algoriphagus hitonicola]|uniref:Acyl-ACP thioesterase n=1 Tax=Algoriphagus hitonicola TaxID=435880 RepID=A0A1I2NLM9_9BACT|nr:acyl-ACP thioesterase domain-containing protein [Algoriphagus hitonicola]SFG04742.1 Acyl-ACP thioesterase [Algoriphagus hitonicola]
MTVLPEGFQFSKAFEIGSYQVNPKGLIRLKDLGDLFQEIAWKHADSANFGRILLEKNLMWALSRLEIKLWKSPVWGQQITIYTGGRGIEKLYAFREFLVVAESGEVLARAMSSWLLVHTETKRIQRPAQVLTETLFSSSKPSEWQPQKVDLPSLPALVETEYVVQASDLDLYDHVNNTSYIRLVEDLLGSQNLTASTLLINYMAECKLRDQIQLSLYRLENSTYIKGQVSNRIVFLASALVVEDK